MKLLRTVGALCLFAFTASPSMAQDARLLRFPAVHGNQIVFTYAADLYTVATTGGVARKLTNDVGFEMFARFSPDGKRLAFTGQYDGNTEVYIMPAEGGVPQRLTYTATLGRDDVSDRMGPNNIVMTWKDDKTIVYRSRRIEKNDFIGQLFYASVDGGIPEQLPLPRGGFCSFSPDKKKMAYNRVFREFRTWKRYRGGQADEVWIYDFETKQISNVTNNKAQDIIPMWSGNKIYFLSDRDSRMNLFVYDLTSKETKKLTDFSEFDVKFPSLGDKAIVFENGGFIYKMDLATEKAEKVSIQILEDFDIGRGGLRDVSKEISNFEISPDGSRALFGARGDVFTVPAKNGNTRNITGTSGVHERNSKWSPDGKWIAYVSDASGEDEVYVEPQNGSLPAGRHGAPPTQLTKNADTYKYQIYWSPDSKKLLWADKKLRLHYVDVESKKVTEVAQAKAWEYSDYSWSPDSKWIAYAQQEEKTMSNVYLYSIETGKSHVVTDGWFDSYQPAFSSDGKYLFFVSDRTFNPTYGQTEWNHTYGDMAGIYLVTLAKETKSPFAPKSDEVKLKKDEKDEEKKDDKKDEKKSDKKVSVKIDVDGIQQRITVLPISAGGYNNLQSVGDKLFYVRNSSKQEKAQIVLYDLDKQKETELGEFNGYEISADGKKMLVGGSGSFFIIDLPGGKIDAKDKLNLGDMKVKLDRRAEWNQIFNECWRQMRDFLFDPHLHGVDWKKLHDTYAQLLPFVNNRADLTYIIGEMIGELNIGHSYVGGGDFPKPERIELGLLGAKLDRDAASKYYRITKILKGQNWDKSLRSPLTEIGVDATEGEYIIAVDGKATNDMNDIYEALVGKAGKQVTLTLNASPKETGSHETVVVPTADERSLYYYNWVEGNIEKVSKATDGKVGYLHIPDMGAGGLNEFVKHFYPQVRKDAMIIDVRGNGGGNVSPMIIERLRRDIAMISIARNSVPTPDPATTILGPKVLMIDEFSASDGDIVGYRFRKYGLGKLIGKRTWGGVVGIRGSLPLLDGGFLNRPEFSRYDVEGKEWVMEGKGVEPDIYVDNDPAREFNGIDEQLNKAIDVIKEELKKNPPTLAPPPPYPDKSR
ncbi:MAG: PD40 domain-containing protein [Ignavibacteriae bacterium]|nr:PD40 domain-containing protein [Ignavibacteriota bacterium]